jgi:uncharacterized membrane protein
VLVLTSAGVLTRRVTAAWPCSSLIAATTCALFYVVPLQTWSMFANFCVLPLIGLMFAAEYAVNARPAASAAARHTRRGAGLLRGFPSSQ